MSTWTQKDIHKHMHVYTSDHSTLGHVGEVYEDSFLVQKGIFGKDRYFPYSTIASIEDDKVHLTLSEDAAQVTEWQKRPDYEDHLGDPTQLNYDRGHGIHDPFDETE